ncbi:hypothetical protein AVEN_234841-1 [Araneus ventricosus]|uniref:Fatty acyl-CoA reductase n=1 Tax=Araneus ventricosus TaxID=182803 RepID=A0A4Y2FA34_ARAVE|nr:hypothetical protein AVEN_234841-1 [Araneus ventricosus]
MDKIVCSRYNRACMLHCYTDCPNNSESLKNYLSDLLNYYNDEEEIQFLQWINDFRMKLQTLTLPVEELKELVTEKIIFEKHKKETPELLGKVRVISGDASLPNLGMNEDDTHLLLKEVSIVFHCAAAVNFKKPLEFLLKNNVLSLCSVIELCRKMRKFEVLVYTSTAYSNANHLIFPLKEEVYRLPFHAGKFLDALK